MKEESNAIFFSYKLFPRTNNQMDSSSVTIRGRSRVVPKELDNNNHHLKPGHVLRPHPSGRTPFFSSYSSMLPDDASRLSAPSTPLHFSGIPFSWEKTPGIPKKQSSCRRKDKDSAAAALLGRSLLPLPPSATPSTSRRFTGADEVSLRKKVLFPGGAGARYQWDPFVAALVECSKEEGYGNNGKSNGDHDNWSNLCIGRRVSRSISDRFGFVALYGSCKRATPISESIIYLPRSIPSPYFIMNGK